MSRPTEVDEVYWLEWETCARCSGSGGPAEVWDEETHSHTQQVCSFCGGRGGSNEWRSTT